MRDWVRQSPKLDESFLADTVHLHSAALCQVFDSIFLDVPMSKVKFNVNTEYAYIQNFKVLQSEQPGLRRRMMRDHKRNGC
jgi:hypothetical protein